MNIKVAKSAGEDTPGEMSDKPSLYSMRKHSPELDRLLRDRGVVVVHADYRGMDGRGGFDSLRFTTAAGSCGDFRWDIRRDSVTHCHCAQVRGTRANVRSRHLAPSAPRGGQTAGRAPR